jgi:predicted RNA-binding protein with PUA-like domain
MPKRSPPKSQTAPLLYWLMKTEPDVFSIGDLAKAKKKTTHWDGVRNYQARNFMRDLMKLGHPVLVYHSNADPSCIVGTAIISRESYPDFTAWDKNDPHFDPKSNAENPTWFMVDITLETIFKKPLSLAELKAIPTLAKMELLRKGSRLSVQPVRAEEFELVCKLGEPRKV